MTIHTLFAYSFNYLRIATNPLGSLHFIFFSGYKKNVLSYKLHCAAFFFLIQPAEILSRNAGMALLVHFPRC